MKKHTGEIKSYPTLNKFFNEEYFVKFNPKLAKLIGQPCAIILQQILYWVDLNDIEAKHFHDGHTWMYNSVTNWQKLLPFMAISTITRAINYLKKQNFIIVGNFNKMKIDRTTWYRPNYTELAKFEEVHHSELINGFTQNELIDLSKMSEPLPKNTKEKHRENNLSENNSSKCIPDQKSEEKENADTDGVILSRRGTSDFSTPLTQLQLWEIASEKNVSYPKVRAKYNEVLKMLDNLKMHNFYGKRNMEHLLSDFIKNDIQKGFIEPMSESEKMIHKLDHPNEKIRILRGLVAMELSEGNTESANKYKEQYNKLYSEGAREGEGK